MTRLSGRHAIVTGGGTGVGAAIALGLAQAGARVTIAGRRQEMLEATAAQDSNIRWAICDVTDAAALACLIEDASDVYGPIDIAVANAGAAASVPFARMGEADFRGALDVNLVGVFNLFRAVHDGMTRSEYGRLIAIASTAGLKGYPYVSGYCAAKHGVVGLVRALALELAGTAITVNAVCPGYTETAMLEQAITTIMRKTGRSREETEAALKAGNPQRRFIKPQEIADAVLYLCGEDARSVTGQALSISGGEI